MTIAPLPPTLEPPTSPHPCGLGALVALIEGVETAFPLTEVRVRTSIVGDCARTIVEQAFDNPHDVPLEATHLFPLPEDGAVVKLTLIAGEVMVEAVCKERKEAEQDFAEARQAGHRAALLTQERSDVHTIRVTRIPPGEGVRVRIELVERLERSDGRYQWRFPTVIAPRYLPGRPVKHDGPGVLPATDQVPDADRLQPPIRLEGGTTLDLEVAIALPEGTGLRQLQVAQHAMQLTLDDRVRIAPSADATLDRDFVLAFSTAADDALESRAWTDGSHTLVTIEPPARAFVEALPRDAVYVIDISGSMSGVKLEAARKALKTALHGMSPGDRFRLIAFDDRLEPMSKELLPYTDDTLARADAWISALASRGGTQMLPAIKEALRPFDAPLGERSASVLFITDGQAWNEDELVAAVANRKGNARFFTFGIDTAVNSALLTRLARVGGGTCELATPSDDIELKVANLEARFGEPIVEGVGVENPDGTVLQAARLARSAVFTGRPASVLVEGSPDAVVLRGTTAQGAFEDRVTPKRLPTDAGWPDGLLGALWARSRVAALEDRLVLRPFEEEALRPEILRIALAHGIASKFTAFVAVDDSRVVEGELRQVNQPAESPHAWGAAGGAPGGPPSGAIPLSAPMAAPADKTFPGLGAAPMPPPAPAPRKAKARRRSRGRAQAPNAAAPEGFALREEARQDAPVTEAMADGEAGGGGWFDAVSRAASGVADVLGRVTGAGATPTASSESVANVPAPAQGPLDEAGLARTQQADGSFGGDVARTIAALLFLVLSGHTRRTGARRRTVAKAAKWLDRHRSEPGVAAALATLEKAEAGESITADASWSPFYTAGSEGRALKAAAGA